MQQASWGQGMMSPAGLLCCAAQLLPGPALPQPYQQPARQRPGGRVHAARQAAPVAAPRDGRLARRRLAAGQRLLRLPAAQGLWGGGRAPDVSAACHQQLLQNCGMAGSAHACPQGLPTCRWTGSPGSPQACPPPPPACPPPGSLQAPRRQQGSGPLLIRLHPATGWMERLRALQRGAARTCEEDARAVCDPCVGVICGHDVRKFSHLAGRGQGWGVGGCLGP